MAGGGGISAGAIVLAVIAGVLAVISLLWIAARVLGIEPRWSLILRHAVAEAGTRTAATLTEFADWVRLGR